jgi:hypothetical protein
VFHASLSATYFPKSGRSKHWGEALRAQYARQAVPEGLLEDLELGAELEAALAFQAHGPVRNRRLW